MATFTDQSTLGKDTNIQEGAPTNNYGDATQILVNNGGSFDRAGLVEFDLSTLSGVTVTSATLSLYLANTNASARSVNIHRILSGNGGWTELGATWNTKDGTTAWAGSAGLETAGTDYSSTLMATLNVPGATLVDAELSVSLDITEVEAMIAGNYGVLLRKNTGDVRFWSSDYNASLAPKLVIEYTEAGGGGDLLPSLLAPKIIQRHRMPFERLGI